MSLFSAANILLPNTKNMESWAVIACDQFTSQPEYWAQVQAVAENKPSAFNLVLPECYLTPGYEKRIPVINATMEQYLKEGLFREYADSYIYIERTLQNGAIRRGVLGVIDLEKYDYAKDSASHIRATEQTVIERIPPRVAIRENAPIELPHIIVFCDDAEDILVGGCAKNKESYQKLYDFDLMCGGGHIVGWLVNGTAKQAVDASFAKYKDVCDKKYGAANSVVLAMGDGNHSLATAKACYEKLKATHGGEDLSKHPARYALVEIENIQDEAQEFEPIHRIIINCDVAALKEKMLKEIGAAAGHPVTLVIAGKQETVYIDPSKGALAVKTVQDFLDAYLAANKGDIDYIHGADTVAALAKAEDAIGIILPPFNKEALFASIHAQGPLPRKTFSIGHAVEKRYYLEARKIK